MVLGKTLKTLASDIKLTLAQHPEWGDLPLVYATDEEGNGYHKIHNDVCPMQMESMDGYFLEPVDDSTEGFKDEINCICIN